MAGRQRPQRNALFSALFAPFVPFCGNSQFDPLCASCAFSRPFFAAIVKSALFAPLVPFCGNSEIGSSNSQPQET
jgi:hypothetical protein